MNKIIKTIAIVLIACNTLLTFNCKAQSGIITTVAGNGSKLIAKLIYHHNRVGFILST